MTSLMRWSPVSDLLRFEREATRWFGLPSVAVPASELVRDTDGWRLRVAVPGVEPDRITLEVHDGMLSVSGEVGSRDPWEAAPGVTRFAYGRFHRTFAIPPEVAADRITATHDNGMLEVALPAGRAATPRSIGIDAPSSRVIPVGGERWIDKGRRLLRRLGIGNHA